MCSKILTNKKAKTFLWKWKDCHTYSTSRRSKETKGNAVIPMLSPIPSLHSTSYEWDGTAWAWVMAFLLVSLLFFQEVEYDRPFINSISFSDNFFPFLSSGNPTPGSWYNSLSGQTHLSESCLRSYSHPEQTLITPTSSFLQLQGCPLTASFTGRQI